MAVYSKHLLLCQRKTSITGLPENRRRPQETIKDCSRAILSYDAKFYVKLAVRGKVNVGLSSDIWSLID